MRAALPRLVVSPRPSDASGKALSERVRSQVKRSQRERGSGCTPSTSRTATDKTRYSQTLQPGSDEYYAFYLNRRKGERQAQHESAGNGWTHTEENNVVRPWLHEKELRRKNAEGVQRKQKDADKQLLQLLQCKARARDREEAKGLMMDLHRWIARMTARIEMRATSAGLSDTNKTALRRDQLQLRNSLARLLQFTNVLAKGNTVNRSLLDQLRKFHCEVQQQEKVTATYHRGRREGLPPQAQLQDLATQRVPSATYGKAETARSREVASDSYSLMDWRSVYETDGISVGIRTYRSPKDKIVEENAGTEVELLWKVRYHSF